LNKTVGEWPLPPFPIYHWG